MTKLKHIVLMFFGMHSLTSLADTLKPYKAESCKNSQILSMAMPVIRSIDPKFDSNDSSCNVVWTKSIFPKKNKSGLTQFEKGIQLSIYQDYHLKYICLPGWICKKWKSPQE